ncbi:MAG: 30S ribosomal protein S16 [Deltaproteobacteria bacterium]|nr:30S ribosomal protein S16 [Deltaproteobacteria bacterium]MBI3296267.1 30S ribosomal protein S16 [Deltaproteobacteria bacterium]
MTVIRFARHGTKKRPVFRIVVQNKTSPRDGKFIEHLGNFAPQAKDAATAHTVDKVRLQYWLGVGAQPSTSVRTHLRGVFAEFRGTPAVATAPPAAQKAEKMAETSADAPKKKTAKKESK